MGNLISRVLGCLTTNTTYESVIGNWDCWAKTISIVTEIQGGKELDSKLLHYFSVAGIPTSADECLEADRSNLTK